MKNDMKIIQDIAKELKIVPKLRLGTKLIGGGVESTGPHHVKFLEEPVVVIGKDEKGKPRRELAFILDEAGIKYRWNVPIMSKENTPSYMIERLMDIKVGDSRILEMAKYNQRNYIDIRKDNEASEAPDDAEERSLEAVYSDVGR